MPLTPAEYEFLAAYSYEYGLIPPTGPATRKLRERGIVYSDVNMLLDAYNQADPPRIEQKKDEHGNIVEELAFGRYNPNPLDPPWPDKETARRRNEEILAERETK